jgi:hypothetical protein
VLPETVSPLYGSLRLFLEGIGIEREQEPRLDALEFGRCRRLAKRVRLVVSLFCGTDTRTGRELGAVGGLALLISGALALRDARTR